MDEESRGSNLRSSEQSLVTSDTMMSICLRSFLKVFISCSGSLWIPTQQPFTKIFVALKQKIRVRG